MCAVVYGCIVNHMKGTTMWDNTDLLPIVKARTEDWRLSSVPYPCTMAAVAVSGEEGTVLQFIESLRAWDLSYRRLRMERDMLLSANIANIQARAYARNNLADYTAWLLRGTDDVEEVRASLHRVMREEYAVDNYDCEGNDDEDDDGDQLDGDSDSGESDKTPSDGYGGDSPDDTDYESDSAMEEEEGEDERPVSIWDRLPVQQIVCSCALSGRVRGRLYGQSSITRLCHQLT